MISAMILSAILLLNIVNDYNHKSWIYNFLEQLINLLCSDKFPQKILLTKLIFLTHIQFFSIDKFMNLSKMTRSKFEMFTKTVFIKYKQTVNILFSFKIMKENFRCHEWKKILKALPLTVTKSVFIFAVFNYED